MHAGGDHAWQQLTLETPAKRIFNDSKMQPPPGGHAEAGIQR